MIEIITKNSLLSIMTYSVLAVQGDVIDVPIAVEALQQIGEDTSVVQIVNDFLHSHHNVRLCELHKELVGGHISDSQVGKFRQKILGFGMNPEVPINFKQNYMKLK